MFSDLTGSVRSFAYRMGPIRVGPEIEPVPKKAKLTASAGGPDGTPPSNEQKNTRVLRLPADVRLVSTSGVPVTQITMPISGSSQELIPSQHDEEDIPSGQRSPAKGVGGIQGACRVSAADDMVPPYGHMPSVSGDVDMEAVKGYMNSTNAKIDALTSTVSGLTKWMETYMPVVHKTAVATGVDMGPGPSGLGTTYTGPTSTMSSASALGKPNVTYLNLVPQPSTGNSSQDNTPTNQRQANDPTETGQDGNSNIHVFNNTLMQELFRQHE